MNRMWFVDLINTQSYREVIGKIKVNVRVIKNKLVSLFVKWFFKRVKNLKNPFELGL